MTDDRRRADTLELPFADYMDVEGEVTNDTLCAETLIDPSYVMSADELRRNAEEDQRAAQYAESFRHAIPWGAVHAPAAQRTVVTLNVGKEGQFREPNQLAYVNHCGPSATQVALQASLSNVSSLDDLARLVKTNVNKKGTYLQDICRVLNSQLSAARTGKSYIISYHDSVTKTQFANNLKSAIDQGKPVITGIDTYKLPGWVVSAPHIVTVYGYETTTDNGRGVQPPDTIHYVETASRKAGYNGPYFVKVTLDQFWSWIYGGKPVRIYCR